MEIKKLIIKNSYSLLPNWELKSNWGDLIRTTVLTNCFNSDVFWLTDKRAKSLLKWFIDYKRIITYDNLKSYNLSSDLEVYNADNYVYDKDVFDIIKGKWHGYLWDGNNLSPENKTIKVISPYTSLDSGISWQKALIEGMGLKWNKQDYALCSINGKISKDIGLNWHVHPSWSSKQWPSSNWKELEDILKRNCSVSWQKGLDDFEGYMKWLNSCKLVVTVDTLGLHLASALRKKVVAIVGATESREYSYGRVSFIKPASRDCMPCNSQKCRYTTNCLSEIEPEKVAKVIYNLLNKTRY